MNNIIDIINKYLSIYPEETDRLKQLKEFINNNTYENSIDWNNFDGHIVSSGFVYAKEDNKFLVLYHKDIKMFLYPGGHIDATDNSIFDAAKREVIEETGLSNIKAVSNIPFDIDTHRVKYNERLNLPEHYHFDFRYLFEVDKISDVTIDSEESSEYKWIDVSEFENTHMNQIVVYKLKSIIKD